MIRHIKKTCAKATWPLRKRFSRSKTRLVALDDMRHLQVLRVKEPAIRKARYPLICRIGPGTEPMTGFLDHYRRIGVDHFLLVDDGSSEEVLTSLSEQTDCSLWKSLLGFGESDYGRRFFHALLHTYCLRKWTLCVDPDELFIFPYMETRGIQDLAGQLDDCERTTLWAIRVEAYGAGPVLETDRLSEDLRYFDPSGYYQSYGRQGQLEVRGGPGMRLAKKFPLAPIPNAAELSPESLQRDFPDAFAAILDSARLDLAPTLHKIPFIKMDESFFYQFRNRNSIDEKLNWAHKWHPCPTGVLWTPKYHRQYGEKLLSGSGASGIPGWSDVESMLTEQLRINPDFSFMEKWSARFESSESLIECGLMSDGAALRPSSRLDSLVQTLKHSTVHAVSEH